LKYSVIKFFISSIKEKISKKIIFLIYFKKLEWSVDNLF